MYFMVGHRVNYYIFTHWPDYVPCIPLQKGRQIVILKVQSCANWQEISMHRMEGIRNFTEQRFYEEVNYLICANVDMKITWAWRSSPPCLAPPILTSMSLVKKISPMNAGLSHRSIFLMMRGTFITQGPYLGGPCQRFTNPPRPATR